MMLYHSGAAESWSRDCVSLACAVGAETLAHRREDIDSSAWELIAFLSDSQSQLPRLIKR